MQQQVVRLWPKTIGDVNDSAIPHLARYSFAKSFLQNKTVCDIACGVGYGSFYLSQFAGNVVGMDISEDAIEWAKQYFQNDKITFYCADGSNQWPFDKMFDIITSFETLEHVQSPDAFLSQLDYHLSDKGTLFMSVPNGPRDKNKTDNPYHLHHFSAEEFQDLINKYFAEPQFYSQAYKKNLKHYTAKFLNKTGLAKKQRYFLNNYYLSEGLDSNLKTWFVIAKKKITAQNRPLK